MTKPMIPAPRPEPEIRWRCRTCPMVSREEKPPAFCYEHKHEWEHEPMTPHPQPDEIAFKKIVNGEVIACSADEFAEWLNAVADGCAANSDSASSVIHLANAAFGTLLSRLAQVEQERELEKTCATQRESALKVEHEGQREQWRQAALTERKRAEAAEQAQQALREALRKARAEMWAYGGEATLERLRPLYDEMDAALAADPAPKVPSAPLGVPPSPCA